MGLSTFFGLNIGVNALDAMNQAENVVSNNIANQNTPGYVQETANMVEATPYPPLGENTIAGQVGQGVLVSSVTRQTSAYIDQQDRLNQGAYQMYATHSTGLTEIQGILNEPSSNGMQNALDQFFTAWQTLSGSPSDTAARQSVLTQAQMLGQTFSTVTSRLEQLQSSTLAVIEGTPSYTMQSGAASPIASDVEVLNAPQSASDTYKLSFHATSSDGSTAYTVQLQDANGNNIGSPVAITGAGTYTLGSSNGLLVSAQIPDPSTLVPPGSTLPYTQTDTFTPPGGQLGQLNEYAQQINQLNQQIVSANSFGQNANALLDQRDSILDEMSQLANISYDEASNGAVSVSLGNIAMVSATGGVTPLTLANLPQVTSGSIAGNQQIVADTQNLLSEMNGFLTSFASQVNAIQQQGYGATTSDGQPIASTPPLFDVNEDAAGNVVLSLHSYVGTGSGGTQANPKVSIGSGFSSGSGLSGVPVQVAYAASYDDTGALTGGTVQLEDESGNPIGQPVTLTASQLANGTAITVGDPATNETLSFNLSPASALFTPAPVSGQAGPYTYTQTDMVANNSTTITASDVAASAYANQPGDNTNALAMVALQNDASAYNNGTFDQGIAQMVSNVGIEANSVSSSESTANSLAQQSSSMRQSIEGVDANQQETLMVQFQNSYDAAAKFISIVDSMLQTLINMVSGT
ncbi:hypothetical protein JI721_11280 [Alicyclobacillus cycloheptanicus]|uniref:Flagellar hook-associated protein 1 n=1 Tax=Alicyclobacillus cycloheptanicus TaxID=1457 RepID=A0ABT9XK62_9BACL|nr:flagellar basal body protein [Alicyclobacillus cycloheptanicus]MDQ0190665.1 flagellar hook-associated protein FlgK [Alicyclobacillus cycloheptanicus]WDM00317.1 hypothetical protein JI721_11280 [Alicyclobacillus cycloheptanicus]